MALITEEPLEESVDLGTFKEKAIWFREMRSIHLSKLADQLNLNLPKSFRNRNKTCPHCYYPWSSETISFKVLPSKKSKLRQTLNKKGKKVNKNGQLKELRNNLVLKCKVCSSKSFFSLVKNQFIKKEVKEETMNFIKKKKKKKKKDKFCGLAVSLIKKDNSDIEIFNNKKRLRKLKWNKNSKPAFKDPQKNISGLQKSRSTPKGKSELVEAKSERLVPNPFSVRSQGKASNEKDKKLQSLKNAIKGKKGPSAAQQTLKKFLKLI